MQRRFYFPLLLEEALEILRRKHRFCGRNLVLAYTDRTVALLANRNDFAKETSGEICLLVIEIKETDIGTLLMGDFTHFGPSAYWHSEHVLALESGAQSWLSHEGRFCIELVSI